MGVLWMVIIYLKNPATLLTRKPENQYLFGLLNEILSIFYSEGDTQLQKLRVKVWAKIRMPGATRNMYRAGGNGGARGATGPSRISQIELNGDFTKCSRRSRSYSTGPPDFCAFHRPCSAFAEYCRALLSVEHWTILLGRCMGEAQEML